MSDRPYVPGVSAPISNRRERSRRMLEQLFEPSIGDITRPLIGLVPYSFYDQNFSTGNVPRTPTWNRPPPKYIALRTSPVLTAAGDEANFHFISGCLYGQMMLHILARAGHTAHGYLAEKDLNDMPVSFGLSVIQSIQRVIATNLSTNNPGIDISELSRYIESSYPLLELLMHIPQDHVAGVEESLGVANYSLTAVVHEASIDTTGDSATIIFGEEEVVPIAKVAMCGAIHTRDENGTPLSRHIWDRFNRINSTVNWLFPKIVADASNLD